MATDAEKIVTEFCNAWPRKNIDELLGFFTDDAVYHNIPLEPAKGKDAIRGVINTFLPMAKSLHFKILNSAGAGNIVFNERADVFEVTGSKISAWRDYFDMQMYMKQMS